MNNLTPNPRIVFLNGQFVPIEEAKVSVMDRGFLFADSIYEVIPVHYNQLFGGEQHLQRLEKSLAAIEINNPYSKTEWLALLQQLIEMNPTQGDHRAIYLQVTRGAPAERAHIFPKNTAPTVFIQSTIFNPVPYEELIKGAKAITIEDIRWHWCYVKSTTLLANVLGAEQAQRNNAKEAIYLRNGFAMEGTSSNLFIVKNGAVVTPPLSKEILGGVTRDLVIKLLQEINIPVQEKMISEQELRQADEIWMTGSIKEILPIVTLDDKPINNGQVGTIGLQLIKIYEQYKTKLVQPNYAT